MGFIGAYLSCGSMLAFWILSQDGRGYVINSLIQMEEKLAEHPKFAFGFLILLTFALMSILWPLVIIVWIFGEWM